ncbi:MAG: nuclear transport factor 2 family protein [Longimicrobiales bacterium]
MAAEIEASLRAEIESFESKDCDAVLTFYEDREPLFVVGGKTMPGLADLRAACPGITARIPDGATRPVASDYIHALSPRSGYSVTEFRIPSRPGGPPTSQFVTKVWSKTGGSWRIVHVHESVAPAG